MWLVPALRFPEFSGEWERCALAEICNIVGRIGFRGYTIQDIVDKGTGAIALSPSNITDNRLSYDKDNTYISYFKYEESPEIKVFVGDIVFVKTGSTVGKVAYVDNILCETTLNPQLVVLKKIKCNSFLLGQILSASKFQNAIKRITVGGAVPTLSQNEMGKISVSIPQKMEQKKIATLFHLIDERISVQNKIIDKLETLIKGIRHKVFRQLRKDFGFNSTIGDILSFEQPQRYIVSSAEYSNDDTFIPVLTANKAFILGYTTETDGIYDKGDCIIIDDFTLDCKYVSFPFKVKSSAIKILTANNKFILRYTYEYLKSLELSTEEHKRHYIAEIQPYSCVLPDENTLKTIALVFENLAYKLSNEQSLALILNKQRQYLLSKMFI